MRHLGLRFSEYFRVEIFRTGIVDVSGLRYLGLR